MSTLESVGPKDKDALDRKKWRKGNKAANLAMAGQGI